MARYCPYCVSRIEHGNTCTHCSNAQTYHPKSNHLMPGTILNRKYLVGKVLGEGGFGITYVGRDLTLDMKVAIKEYYPNHMASRANTVSTEITLVDWSFSDAFKHGKEQFIAEARTIAKMDKESAVVTVRDFFEQNNSAYIVMEFVEGKDLRNIIADSGKPLPAQELLPLLEPLFNALGELHDIGLIHRDISPDNIMIEDGRARLIDFGCARDTFINDDTDTVLKHGFSPPEQYENQDMGPWTDVYAMAATIYYCLTGKLPPKATDRMIKDELVPPTALGAQLTSKQEKSILKALSLDHGNRYPSMEAFAKDLFIHRRKTGWTILTLVLVLLLGAGAFYIYRERSYVPETTVEVVAAEPEKQEQVVTLRVGDTGVTQEENAILHSLKTALDGAQLEPVKRSNYLGVYYMLTLTNTSDADLPSVRFFASFYDENGTRLYESSSSASEWKKGEEKELSFYYDSSADPAYVELQAQLNGENRVVLSETAEPTVAGLTQAAAENEHVTLTLKNKLPFTIAFRNYSGDSGSSVTISSFLVNSVYSSNNGYSANILIGGKVNSASSTYINFSYRITDESGNVVKEQYSQIQRLSSGDKFANQTIYIGGLPEGNFTLEFVDFIDD